MMRRLLLLTSLSALHLLGGCVHEPPTGVTVSVAAPGIERVYKIDTNLLTGSSPDTEGLHSLQELGVSVVVCVDGPRPNVDLIRELGMRSVHLPIGYDEVPESTLQSLVKLTQEHPETIYVHCHQGQHRGPAVAAVIQRIRKEWNTEQSREILSTCGTSKDYPGLWEATATPLPEFYECSQAQLPEAVKPKGLTELMLTIQDQRDSLDSMGNNYADITATLLVIEESFRELQRGYHTQDTKNSKSWNTEIEHMISTLREMQEDPSGYTDFARIDARCTSCHRAH